MKLHTLMALAAAAAVALPFAASSADSDKRARTGSAADFSTLDRNGDGQISRAEWDAHHRSASAGTTSRAPSGPGTNSQAGPGSDTATTPGTSGKGKAQ